MVKQVIGIDSDDVVDNGEVLEKAAFVVEIDGVQVGFRDMTTGQTTMVNRIVREASKQARKMGEAAAYMDMLGKIFNIIESMVILDEDREHLMDAMLTGKIDVPEAYLILRRGEPEAPDDDTDVVTVVKAKKSVRTASASRVRR